MIAARITFATRFYLSHSRLNHVSIHGIVALRVVFIPTTAVRIINYPKRCKEILSFREEVSFKAFFKNIIVLNCFLSNPKNLYDLQESKAPFYINLKNILHFFLILLRIQNVFYRYKKF